MLETRKDRSKLTPREKEVVSLVCSSMTNRQIGKKLNIGRGTVANYLVRIYIKLKLTCSFNPRHDLIHRGTGITI